MKFIFFLLFIVVAVLEVIGDIFFKEWTIWNSNYLIFAGVFCYTLATIAWAFSLKYEGLAKAVVIFGVLTVIVGVLVGVFIYKEQLTALQVFGILLGFASIVLLEI